MNTMRTAMLLAVMTALFMGVGYLLGGTGGMGIAFLIAAGTNFFSYWNADKMVLAMNHAIEVDERSAPEYYRIVRDLAARAGLPMPKVYLIEADQPNAFATGRNPENAAVAASTGLLQRLSHEEVAAVMAHELAHVQHRDTLTMTIAATLAAGRDINERDTAQAPRVALINESMAHYFFKNENPIGRRFSFTSGEGYPIEIVGVVKDIKDANMKQEETRYVYLPLHQAENPGQVAFYLRTEADPGQIMNAVRREVRRLDANLPIFDVKTVPMQIDDLLFRERLVAALSAAFGLLATLLAAVGLYGVTAYSVARRTREIGIRVALGAEKDRLLWLVLKEVVLMTVAGLAIGIPGAYALGLYVESQLYGLTASDPMIMAGAALLLSLITLLAGWIPAERATRVDPMVALRYE